MNKVFLTLFGTALFLAATGCATAKCQSRREVVVDGQWAREAGQPPTPWHYKHVKGSGKHEPDTGGAGYVTPLPDPGTPYVGQPVQDPNVGGGTVVVGSGGEIQLCQEELVVGKRQVNNGAVLIRKVVKSEPATQTVMLNRDEYVIDRLPAGGTNAPADCFTGKEIVLCLTKEEPVIGTRVDTSKSELVRLRRIIKSDQRQVTGTVRKETLEIVKLADCPTNTPPRLQ